MKKSLTLLVLCMLSLALTASEITKTYHFNQPLVANKGKYQTISFEGSYVSGFPGQPSIPYHSVQLLLPPGEIATSIEVILEDEVPLEGEYVLLPYQPSRPLSSGNSDSFYLDGQVYLTDGNYPQNISGTLVNAFLHGRSVAMCTFTPVVYNPARKTIHYFKTATVKLKTSPSEEAIAAGKNLKSSEDILYGISHFVHNPELLSSYPSKDNRTGSYDLLIISPAQFENEFSELQDMYLIRGLKSEFCSTEFIDSNISGSDLQEKIRNYIIQEYQTGGIAYVLLGGDVQHVPYRGFYCYVQSGSGYEDSDIPSDLYYSALDGNWNDDGDNRWGEPGEDDLLPEVAVSRLPFSDTADLHNMLHKTISYQDDPVTGEMDRPLLAGEHLYSSPLTWGADYLDLLVGYHDDNGYTTTGIPEDDDIYELYDRNATWSANDIIARINEGRSFVHHSGHSNANYTMRLYMSDITNSNFSQVNGVDHNYALIYTHGCICGAFDENDCIAEKMLYIDNFVVAGAFNSRYGWFNEGQTEGPSAHLHREFVDALYTEKIDRIGATHVESKIQTAPWVTAPGQWEEGALRWCFYDCNILGDPALAVWTAEPISIYVSYPQTITLGTASINVNVSHSGTPLNNYNCTFFKDGQLHGTGTTDSLGNATIVFDPPIPTIGDAELIVSGYNCLPATYNTTIIPANGAYVVYESHEMEEITGIVNGLPDHGDYAYLDITIQNAGSADAEDVDVTIRSTGNDDNILIEDSTEFYGTIPAGSSLTIPDAFTFYVSLNTPDQFPATIEVIASSGSKEIWSSSFVMTLLAPNLETVEVYVDDSGSGNGDGILDPGEQADIVISVANTGHSQGEDAWASLLTESNEIQIADTIREIGIFPYDNTELIHFPIEISEDASIGTSVDFEFYCEAWPYNDELNFTLTIGLIKEDFETGDFSSFNWQQAGNQPWQIDSENQYEGDFCMVSGSIDDNQVSLISVNLDVLSDGDISFFRKVSSEEDYDYLMFLIDDVLIDEWAGELAWEEFSYPVSAGNHTFSWQYAKDVYVSSGQDRAWIDYIVFPPVSPSTFIPVNKKASGGMSVTILNNPFRENLRFILELQEARKISIDLIDLNGRSLRSILQDVPYDKGNELVEVALGEIPNGIYFIRIMSREKVLMEKIVHCK